MSFHRSVVVIAGLGASVVLAAGGCFNWDVVPLGGGDDGDVDEPSSGQGGDGGDPGGTFFTTAGPATSGTGASGGAPQTTVTSSVTSSSSASVTTGGGNDCGGGGCAECISCAIDTVCAVEADLCGDSLACLSFWSCSSGCATDGCLSQCADAHPAGLDLFEQAASCVVCSACADECLALADLLGCP